MFHVPELDTAPPRSHQLVGALMFGWLGGALVRGHPVEYTQRSPRERRRPIACLVMMLGQVRAVVQTRPSKGRGCTQGPSG